MMGKIKNIVKWAISILMLVLVLAAFTTKGGILSGIIFLLIAVAVNSLFTNFLGSRSINIKKIIYIPVMVVAFFVSIVFYPTTEKKAEESAPIESSEQAESETLLLTRNTSIEQEHTEQEQVSLATEENTEQAIWEQEKAEHERLAQEQAEQERLAKEKEEQEKLAVEKEEQEKSAQSQGGNDGGNGENFNKYNNSEQQNTEDTWVLNTKSMKIHKPSCKDVKKISPENYSTSSLTLEELKKKGYTTCGHCFN